VIGAILIAIGLVVVLPVIVWAGIGLLSAGASVVFTEYAEETHAGSDLIATNV
jgi:hypothetical protein